MNKKKLEKINEEMNENLNGKKEQTEILPGLTKFFKKTQDSFIKIQDDWNASIDKLLNESLERQKIRQQKRLERLNEKKNNKKSVIERQKIRQQRIVDRWERKRQRMNNYYKHQEELLEKKYELMEKNIENKSDYNKEKLQNSVDRTKKNWTKSVRRQRNFESFLSSLNSWSWKRQMRFLLIIIPLVVIFVIVFKIIQPFIM